MIQYNKNTQHFRTLIVDQGVTAVLDGINVTEFNDDIEILLHSKEWINYIGIYRTKKTNREIIKKTDTPATAWVERAVTGGSGHGERMELIKNKREAIRK